MANRPNWRGAHPPACTCVYCTGGKMPGRKPVPERKPRYGYRWEMCPTCNGTGEVIGRWGSTRGGQRTRCPRCFRAGWVEAPIKPIRRRKQESDSGANDLTPMWDWLKEPIDEEEREGSPQDRGGKGASEPAREPPKPPADAPKSEQRKKRRRRKRKRQAAHKRGKSEREIHGANCNCKACKALRKGYAKARRKRQPNIPRFPRASYKRRWHYGLLLGIIVFLTIVGVILASNFGIPDDEEASPAVQEPTPTPTLVVATPTPAPTPEPPPFPGGVPLDAHTIHALVVKLTNEERVAFRLPPLLEDEAINAIALTHSANMGQTGILSHTLNGQDATDRALAAGYDCEAYRGDGSYTYGLSENIFEHPRIEVWTRTIGFVTASTTPTTYRSSSEMAQALVTGWMNSLGHRENILDPHATRIGIGIYIQRENEYGYSSETVWATQNFSECK